MLFVKESIDKQKEFNWPDIYEKLPKEELFKNFTDEGTKAFEGTHCCQCKTSPIAKTLYFPVHDSYEN